MSDDEAPELNCRTPEEFSNVLVRKIHELIAEHEKEASDTGKTVEFGFELMQQTPGAPQGQHNVLRFEYVCEPGKPARQVKATKAAPLDQYGNPIDS